MIFPAISIRQPWAWAILQTDKDVENRTWPLPKKFIGKPVLIHTGKRIEHEDVQHLLSLGYKVPRDLETGGIVGNLEFKSWSRSSTSTWAVDDACHWHIKRAAPLQFFPCPGRLGFFEVDYPYEV